jgi:acetyl-CoA carboxylase carboxyltransferase component
VRKEIGLGAQALTGGSTNVPMYSGAWPSASLGPMRFEGAVKLGFKAELDAIADPLERQKRFNELVNESLDRGSAQSTASLGETDEVGPFLACWLCRLCNGAWSTDDSLRSTCTT